MELVNLLIAIASLLVAIVAGIYIPLYIHKDPHRRRRANNLKHLK